MFFVALCNVLHEFPFRGLLIKKGFNSHTFLEWNNHHYGDHRNCQKSTTCHRILYLLMLILFISNSIFFILFPFTYSLCFFLFANNNLFDLSYLFDHFPTCRSLTRVNTQTLAQWKKKMFDRRFISIDSITWYKYGCLFLYWKIINFVIPTKSSRFFFRKNDSIVKYTRSNG